MATRSIAPSKPIRRASRPSAASPPKASHRLQFTIPICPTKCDTLLNISDFSLQATNEVAQMDIFELLRANAIAGNDLLKKNDARGDVFAKPRDVDFAFKTRDATRAKDLCEFIGSLN